MCIRITEPRHINNKVIEAYKVFLLSGGVLRGIYYNPSGEGALENPEASLNEYRNDQWYLTRLPGYQAFVSIADAYEWAQARLYRGSIVIAKVQLRMVLGFGKLEYPAKAYTHGCYASLELMIPEQEYIYVTEE